MNLKEAFRFQNKLQALMDEAQRILESERNITKTENTYLRKKVMPEAENETIVEDAPSEYADRINNVVELLLFLLGEREKLFAAIRSAKAKLDIDFDAQASLNANRHVCTRLLRNMADLRSTETVIANGGYGYRFNTDGHQVTYKCDVKRVTTINFDRNLVRKKVTELNQQADEVSTKLDQALVNAQVDYTTPFDVNDSFSEVFDSICGPVA